jgi:hypothetical protein
MIALIPGHTWQRDRHLVDAAKVSEAVPGLRPEDLLLGSIWGISFASNLHIGKN